MKKSVTGSLVIGSLLLTACASQTGWTPTVDPYGDPNAYRLNQDMAECQQLARQASGGTARETAKGVGVGALIGGAAGAAIGAISGNPAAGAAYGAAAGGFGGGTKQGLDAEYQYKRAYTNCMRNRGHNIIN
ncbi:MAG: glycine zipper family protein [Gammaproteobacteria bacterium]